MDYPSDKSATISRLLIEAVKKDKIFDQVPEISKNLDEYSFKIITGIANEAIQKNEIDVGEKYAILGEWAARYAGDQFTRYRLMAWRGSLVFQLEEIEEAEKLLREATDQLELLLSKDNIETFNRFNIAGLTLVNVYLKKEEYQLARDELSAMVAIFQKNNNIDFEIENVLNLINISISLDDLEAAKNHFTRLIQFPEENFRPGNRYLNRPFLDVLTRVILSLFQKNIQPRDLLCEFCVFLLTHDPENLRVIFVYGELSNELGQWQNAIDQLNIIVKRKSEMHENFDASRILHIISTCHSRLGENEEAQEKIKEAIKLNPKSPFLLFAHSQTLDVLGQVNNAIIVANESLEECVKALNNDKDKERLPALYDFILIHRARLFKAIGKLNEAVSELEELAKGDDISKQVALGIRSDWYIEENNITSALECLQNAEQYTDEPALYENQSKQVSLLLQLKNYSKALDILKGLAYKGAMPEQAIELLDQIPKSFADYNLVLKWRGYAKTEAGWPSKGLKDLDKALTTNTNDGELYYLRALTLITFGVKEEDEKKWNRGLSLRSLLSSLDDLYTAVKLDPGYVKAKDTLHWLIERSSTHPDMFEFFSHGGNRKGDLYAVFPALKKAFDLHLDAYDTDLHREFQKSIVLWKLTQDEFIKAGFPLIAESIHLRLADSYLRLSEMDNVEYHLKKASERRFLVNVPLSEEVRLNYEKTIRIQGDSYRTPTLGVEFEYHWVYDYFSYDLIYIQFLYANFRHRLGDIEGAKEYLKMFEPALLEIEQTFESTFTLQMILGIAGIYRDGGEFDKALRLIEFVEKKYKDSPNGEIFYSHALIFSMTDKHDKAISYYEKAIAATANSKKLYRDIGIQYASELLYAGKVEEALVIIDSFKKDYDLETDRTKLYFNTVAAYTYAKVGKIPEAISCFENGRKILEQKRRLITDAEGKMSWLGSQDSLIDIGVQLYADLKDFDRAFEIAESTKGRVLLGELAGGTALSNEFITTVSELEAVEKAIEIASQMEGLDSNQTGNSLKVELHSKIQNLLNAFDSLKAIELNKKSLEEAQKRIKAKEIVLREAHINSNVPQHGLNDFVELLEA